MGCAPAEAGAVAGRCIAQIGDTARRNALRCGAAVVSNQPTRELRGFVVGCGPRRAPVRCVAKRCGATRKVAVRWLLHSTPSVSRLERATPTFPETQPRRAGTGARWWAGLVASADRRCHGCPLPGLAPRTAQRAQNGGRRTARVADLYRLDGCVCFVLRLQMVRIWSWPLPWLE